MPSVELMKPAGALQYIQRRAQIKVVSVAQDDLRFHVVFKLLLRYRLHTSGGAYRHEDGG